MIRHFFRANGWIALIFAVLTVGVAAFWQNERAGAWALADHGVATVATVERKRIEETRRRNSSGGYRTDTDYLVTYAYEAAASDATQAAQLVEHGVPVWVYDDLAVGDSVEIIYLPESPTRADFYPGETGRTARILGWFVLGSVAVTALFAAIAVRLARRALRLDRVGVTAKGIVERVHRQKSSATLTLRYTDAQGVEHKAKAPAMWGAPWTTTQAGAAVSLRYDPENPRNVALVV